MKYTICILLFSTLLLVNSVHSLQGGQNVALGAFPSHALVLVSNAPFGGTIINANHIVTACGIVLNAENHLIALNTVTVRVGSITFTEGTPSGVVAIFPHPEYNPTTFNHDVAVLRTAVNFVFNQVIPRPPIAPAVMNSRVIADGSACQAVGFNAPAAGANPPLQSLAQPFLNRDTACNANNVHNGRVLETMSCAGAIPGTNSGICPSTRGGGIYCNGIFTGIASSGLGCGAANSPGVYTQVRHHITWINAQLTRNQIPQPGATPPPGLSAGSFLMVTSTLLMCLAFLSTKL